MEKKKIMVHERLKAGILLKVLPVLLMIIFVQGCSRLTLKPTEFAWPIESVLKVNSDGKVSDERHSITFDTKELFLTETNDSSAFQDKEVRLIRDVNGYYYITSNNFKNIYVFTNGEGELCLEDKVEISQTGISNPAFNQRAPYIELVNGDKKVLLTNEGIKEDEKDEEK